MTYKIILSLSILALCGVSGLLGYHISQYADCKQELAAFKTPILGDDQ